MKKTGIALLSLMLLLCSFACAPQKPPAADAENPPLRIVTTIFPLYDWVQKILGENAGNTELSMLLDSGVDLHSYQPSAEDIVRISTCDVFLYVGGESDEWIDDALKESQNPDQLVISLLDLLGDGVKAEETVEGMQAEPEEDSAEETESDEHVWLSLKNAKALCGAIADRLAEADPDHADAYRQNAAAYGEQLSALDAAYAEAVQGAAYRTLLFADRFPFRYLADDYGLDYYAAFSGCSAETEASFATIVFLADKLDELGLPAVLQIESADGSIARTVLAASKNPDRPVLTLDSLQSVTAAERGGADYLTRMEQNLGVLKAALN